MFKFFTSNGLFRLKNKLRMMILDVDVLAMLCDVCILESISGILSGLNLSTSTMLGTTMEIFYTDNTCTTV